MLKKQVQAAIIGAIFWVIFTVLYWSLLEPLVANPHFLRIISVANPDHVISAISRALYGATLAIIYQRHIQNTTLNFIKKVREGILLGAFIGSLTGAIAFEVTSTGASELYMTIVRAALVGTEGAIGMLFLGIIISKTLN